MLDNSELLEHYHESRASLRRIRMDVLLTELVAELSTWLSLLEQNPNSTLNGHGHRTRDCDILHHQDKTLI